MPQTGRIIQQGSFQSGEISPAFAGMVNNERFFTSCRIAENLLVTRTLGLSQRGGFEYHDQDVGVERLFFRESSMLIDDIIRHVIVEVFINTVDIMTISIRNAETMAALFSASFPDISDIQARLIDIVSYERYIIVVAPGIEPQCLYSVDDSPDTLHFATLASLYETSAPLDGKEAPVWEDEGTAFPISCDMMMARLIFVHTKWYYGSKAGDPMDFTRTEYVDQGDETEGEYVVTSGSAFTYMVDNQDDDGLKWIRGGLFAMAGSDRGAWIMSNLENGLDATNPNVRNQSGYGASSLPGLYIDGAFFYFDASGVSPRIFTIDNNGPTSIAIGEISSHMFIGRIPKQMLLQTAPESIVWILMDDGQLISFQFEQTTGKAAWCRHHVRNAVIENIAIVDGRRIQAIMNRDGNRSYMSMEKPFSDEWHDTIDKFWFKSLIPDRPWVASAQRIDANDRLEITVNGPIEDNRPYRIINSGALVESYYITEYAVDPASQANEIKKLWIKSPDGEYVTALAEDRIGLDPRGVQILSAQDNSGNQALTVAGVFTPAEGEPILIQFCPDLPAEFYRILAVSNDGTNTSFTMTGPLGEKVDYNPDFHVIGSVMFDVPYQFQREELAGQTLTLVYDRNYVEEIIGDETGLFKFSKPVMGAAIGEPIDSRFAPRFFTDIIGMRKGSVIHFFPYVINTPGLRYGIKKINSVTFPYDEIDFYTGPSKVLTLGSGATPDCNFWMYSAPGSRLEISHIFYELEVI